MEFVPILDLPDSTRSMVRDLRNQPDVRRFMYTSHEISVDEHQAWLTSLENNPRQSVFVIMSNETLMGVVSLNAINTLHKTADWAFYLDAARQGKGLGSQVEFWLLNHAFTECKLEKLNCEVLASNPAVIKMHQKFGFSIEGVRRQNILRDGVRLDVVLLGITAEEWTARKPEMMAIMKRITGSSSPK
jgi:UDP-4-amino-4,6-dideoxy-N-acetyl-beta-L-altrosamine N-acetyltransferase